MEDNMRKKTGAVCAVLLLGLCMLTLSACFGTGYTVTFDSMGGSEVASKQSDRTSGTVGRPEDPIWKDYEFVGWYIDQSYSKLWSFNNDKVTNGMTLYAKWIKCFESGLGTDDDPYVVAQSYQLKYIAKNPNAFFELANDIDCAGLASFSPIGSNLSPFTGEFDGAGFKISNLVINGRGSAAGFDAQGFFGYVLGSYISDLELSNITIEITETANVHRYIGGVAGYAVNSEIRDCKVNGSITGQYSLAQNKTNGEINIGGIVGRLGQDEPGSYTYVRDCISSATIYCGAGGESYAGGIAGYAVRFDIDLCLSSGAVTVTGSHNAFAGGIVGYAAVGSVNDCLSSGKIMSTANGLLRNSYVGGIVGYADSIDSKSVLFYRCIAAGVVTSDVQNANKIYKGGFVGYFSPELNQKSILDCVNSEYDTGLTIFHGNTSVSADKEWYNYSYSDMRRAENFSGWYSWIIEDGKMPRLDI